MITFRNVSKWFGSHLVLDNINLTVATGEIVVICGPSGAGKTTIIRTINGLEPIQEGEVLVNGISLSDPKTDLTTLRADIGMVFQHLNLYPHLTALENVMLAPWKVRGLNKNEARNRALECLGNAGLERKCHVYPSQLSGGEQQRVAFARAFAMNPKIMLLDEPTSALDPELVKDALDAITAFARAGMTLIIVTHQMALAQHIANRAVFMDKGQIVETAPPSELVLQPSQDRTKEFMSRILYGTGYGQESWCT